MRTRFPSLRRAALLPAAALCVALGAAPAHASVPAPGRDFFGVNAQGVFALPQSAWDAQLAAIAATGVTEVRRDAFWSDVEPTAPVNGVHRYVWTKPDAVAAALARHGLRWYPIVDYSTPWAGTVAGAKQWKSAPANPADFAAYAAAFARRYGTGGTFWAEHPSLPALPVQSYEIWNEPNLADFWPDVVGAGDRYAALLAAAAPAVRAADPHGRVVVGGLSPSGLTIFLDEVEAQRPGLIAGMDAVAFHPYGTTWTDTGGRIKVLRDWLDQHGAAALPIEVTETGWASPPMPEDVRAQHMDELVRGLAGSSCDITRFLVHTWLTPDVDLTDPNDYFGIARSDGTLKPTGAAFVAAVAAVQAGTAAATSDPCAGRVVAAAAPTDPVPADPPAAPADPAPTAPSLPVPTLGSPGAQPAAPSAGGDPWLAAGPSLAPATVRAVVTIRRGRGRAPAARARRRPARSRSMRRSAHARPACRPRARRCRASGRRR